MTKLSHGQNWLEFYRFYATTKQLPNLFYYNDFKSTQNLDILDLGEYFGKDSAFMLKFDSNLAQQFFRY